MQSKNCNTYIKYIILVTVLFSVNYGDIA